MKTENKAVVFMTLLMPIAMLFSTLTFISPAGIFCFCNFCLPISINFQALFFTGIGNFVVLLIL